MCSLTSLFRPRHPGCPTRLYTWCRVADGEFRHPGLIRHPPPPFKVGCSALFPSLDVLIRSVHPCCRQVAMITRVKLHINIVQCDHLSSVAYSWSWIPSLTPSHSHSFYSSLFVLFHSHIYFILTAALLAWRESSSLCIFSP
jgi:hypothetical protein